MLFMLVVGFPEGENSGGVMRHLPKSSRRWRKLMAGAIYSLYNLMTLCWPQIFPSIQYPNLSKVFFSLELQNSEF